MDEVDYQRGRQALVHYHNEMLRYPSTYKFTLDQLLEHIKTRAPFQKNFIHGLGLGIKESGATFSQVRMGMIALANKGKGSLPVSNNSFTQAIANSVRDNLNYLDATRFVAVESAKDIVKGAQIVGDNVLGYGKFLTENLWLVPIFVLAGVFVYAKATRI